MRDVFFVSMLGAGLGGLVNKSDLRVMDLSAAGEPAGGCSGGKPCDLSCTSLFFKSHHFC